MSLHATIQFPSGNAVDLKMDGDWGKRSPVVITRDDPDEGAMDEDSLRYWLKHIAMGLFGHSVGSDTQAAPADVHHALLNLKEWRVTIRHADIRTVRLDLPPGAVH